MKQLTKAEEEIMQILWNLKKATVKEILDEMPSPQPAYNTVSTIIRILEDKGIVDYEKVGKSHYYYPLLEKSTYSNQNISKLVENYFQGSFKNLVSFFVKENDLSIKELESIIKEIDKK